MTEYRDIDGHEGYRVGSDGTVWTRHKGKWGLGDKWRQLKPGRCGSPSAHYNRFIVSLGRGKQHYVHHLVLEAFVGPRPDGCEACHIDGYAGNNRLENLRWDTRAGNMRDMAAHGRKKGERHHAATLTEDLVRMIRACAASGQTHQAIADALGVNRRNVSRIVDRTRWPHVA